MLRKGLLVLLAAMLTLAGAEAGVRTFADDLPQALPWGNLEIELKAHRMAQLQRMGVRASVAFVGSSMTDVGIDPDAMDIDSAPDELPVQRRDLRDRRADDGFRHRAPRRTEDASACRRDRRLQLRPE
jgi:hypothetical protein